MDVIRKQIRFRFTAGLLIFGAFLLASGCQKGNPPAQQSDADTVAVVAPKPPERPMIILYSYSPIGLELRQMVQTQTDTVWAGREITYAYGPGPIVLANSGVGIANAAATTQFLIDRYNPKGIIYCGIASAVNPAHHIGDLVIPERYVTFDYGYWGDQGLVTDSVTVGRADSAGFDRALEIPVDLDLYAELGEAANNAAYLLHGVGRRLPEIHQGGTAISGNAFLDNKSKRDQLYKQLKAQITDTESAGVVQTAHAAGIPIVVIRACAAPAGESTTSEAQADLVDFFKVSAHNVALVLRQFLTPQ
jgi:adenosylhomocysteine nucleosidase